MAAVDPASSAAPESPSMAVSLHRACSNCGGDIFAIEDTTGNAGAAEGIYHHCLSCGQCDRITFTAMGATQDYT